MLDLRVRDVIAGCLWVCLPACFDGADARHLPCERDDDCGLGQTCMAGPGRVDGAPKFCDGPADDGGSTSSSSTTTTSGPGSSSSGSEESSSGGSDSTGMPPIPVCGNGMVELGEDCEPTEGELVCTDACREVVWFETFTNGPGQLVAAVPPGLSVPTPLSSLEFSITPNNTYGIDEDYLPSPMTGAGGAVYAYAGPFVLPALSPLEATDVRYELRMRHRYAYENSDDCGGTAQTDGGFVQVWVDGQPNPIDLVPAAGYPGVIAVDPSCEGQPDPLSPNPYSNHSGFVGQDPAAPAEMTSVAFPIEGAVANALTEPFYVLFVSSYNCSGCAGAASVQPGWRFDDIQLGAFDLP